MAAQTNNYVKISTPIRTIKSEIGQVRISLYNDQIAMNFQPATGKTDYGTVKYNGAPQFAPNVRFSVGVGAAIAKLIRDRIVPESDNYQANQHWEVFANKRGNYESYLHFDLQNGQIVMTGIEVMNGIKKTAAYRFPVTIITEGTNQSVNVQGEALSLAELLSEIGGSNEMPAHLRQYNQAVKDNLPQNNGNNSGTYNNAFSNSQAPTGFANAQPVNNWHPS